MVMPNTVIIATKPNSTRSRNTRTVFDSSICPERKPSSTPAAKKTYACSGKNILETAYITAAIARV